MTRPTVFCKFLPNELLSLALNVVVLNILAFVYYGFYEITFLLLLLYVYLQNGKNNKKKIYKFATFSINYVKLKLFNQLLQSQFIVANILVSLDCLNLLRLFNILDIFWKHCSVNIFSNLKMC